MIELSYEGLPMNRGVFRSLQLVWACMLAASLAYADELPTASPEAEGVSADRLTRLHTLAEQYVNEGKVAGIVTLV
ncbi:MAG: hypothetical protein ACO3UV_14080, partial [Pseudomonadales bacterium]